MIEVNYAPFKDLQRTNEVKGLLEFGLLNTIVKETFVVPISKAVLAADVGHRLVEQQLRVVEYHDVVEQRLNVVHLMG